MPKIKRIDIPQLVRVRKYEVDCQRLCDLLREHKQLAGKSNKQLAEALNAPHTQVEHWFRRDSCFSIPGEEIWEALKEELSITTTEFDESIMTFEERPGVYEKSERCYFADGIAPTLTSTSAGNEKIIVEVKPMDKAVAAVQKASLVAESHMTEPAVLCPKRTEYGKAIRKAYEAGEIKESRHNMTSLQPRTDGISNTLTTVQKDNYVMEPTLRVRKLTPKECFRLMGFSDEDFAKAETVNSNTQLYKQAGNSIGVPVVEHILSALFDCGALIR